MSRHRRRYFHSNSFSCSEISDSGSRFSMSRSSASSVLLAAVCGAGAASCLWRCQRNFAEFLQYCENNHYVLSALLPAWCRAWRGTRRTPGSGRRRGRRWGGSRSRTRRTGWATRSWGWCRCCPGGSAGRHYPWARPTGSNWTGEIGYKYKCVLACASETAPDL